MQGCRRHAVSLQCTPPRPIVKRTLLFATVAVTIGGCRSHHIAEVTPAMLASVHADVRVVNGETTYVTRAASYELVGRGKADLAIVQPMLDRGAAVIRRIFSDTLATLMVTVRRDAMDGGPFVLAAPVPGATG